MNPLRAAASAVAVLAAAACGGACGGNGDPAPPAEPLPAERALGAAAEAIVLADVTASSGLDAFRQQNGAREKPFILESIGGGVAFLDHDGDGNLDVYFTNGSSLDGFPPGEEPRDALFAGDGNGRFADVTAARGLGATGWTCGVRVADVEGDGDPDLYLTAHGPNVLYRNDGGRFTNVTAEAGVGDERWSTGACFLDADLDGDLDLYVANYVVFNREWLERNRRDYHGASVYFGPNGIPGQPDRFYRNEDGTFADASEEVGIAEPRLHGFHAVAFDHDLDGRTDIYVANDSHPNLLWVNRPDGTFEDRALRAGLARSAEGREQAGMGIALGDADGDGRLDVYVTNFAEDYFTLYRNDGGGFYADVTYRAGLGRPTMSSLGWGCALVDLDLDADLDLFVANGHVYPQVDLFDLGTRYRQRNQVFENDGAGAFREVASEAGLALELCSRGAAFGDYDNDGDVDCVVNNLDDGPTLLRNDSRRAGSWIQLRVVGAGGNRDAIGARVEVRAGGTVQVAAVGAGSGFLGSNDPRLHFGLGGAERVDEVRVTWPGGAVEVFRDLEPGGVVQVQENFGEERNR